MKKILLTSACVLAVAGAALAQGNIQWTGPSFTAVTFQTNSTTYSPFFGGGSTGSGAVGVTLASGVAPQAFYYELLVGAVNNSGVVPAAPTSFAALAAYVDTSLSANNGTVAGRAVVNGSNNGQTVNQLSSTVSNNIVLVGWSANLGTTWTAALANLQNASYLAGLSTTAFFGTTALGNIMAATTATVPGAAIFGSASTANGIPILSLNTQLYQVPTVPEPASMALVALGGASLLLFRRRK